MTQSNAVRFKANELLQLGIEAGKNQVKDKALDLYRQSAAADPTWGIPHFLIGSDYAARGDMEQAELALANAVLLAPEFAMARYQLGTLQFSTGRAATALVTWQPLLNLPEDDPITHFVMGYSALAQDDFENAIGHYKKGLTFSSGNEALAGDIRKILARIAELGMAAPVTPAEATANTTDENHVLLSNYQRQSNLD